MNVIRNKAMAAAAATLTTWCRRGLFSSPRHVVRAFSIQRPQPPRSSFVFRNQQQQNDNNNEKKYALFSSSSFAKIDEGVEYIPRVGESMVVVATGEVLSFSHSGVTGIAAVRLSEEDHVASPPTTKQKPSILPRATGANALQGEDLTGRRVLFSKGGAGIIVAQRPPIAFCICDFTEEQGTTVHVLKSMATVPVSERMIGSILDCLGYPLAASADGSTTSSSNNQQEHVFTNRAIFAPIPQLKDIALINAPMLTGSAMVDAISPIGKGQNMLMIGQEGMRDLAIDALRTQIHLLKQQTTTRYIYALTSPKKEVRAQVIQKLKQAGVLDHIVVVTLRDDRGDGDIATAAEAVTVAATACAIGEAFALVKGLDSLVIVDGIDSHKSLWDWTTRVLVNVYGVDAVVKDDEEGGASSEMRAFYSGLIQRAGRFNKRNGGGSITLGMITTLPSTVSADASVVISSQDFARCSEKIRRRLQILVDKNIPLTPENLRKIQIPIPGDFETRLALQHVDDLISMSDGQIWLSEQLYARGQRPALDPQRSITRVGIGADTDSHADAPAMRALVGGLRFDLAQAANLEGAPGSSADRQLLRRSAYLLAMHQDVGESRTLSENCIVLLAASIGSLNSVILNGATAGSEGGKVAIRELLRYVRHAAFDAMKEIDETLDMTASVRSTLEAAIKSHFSSHV